MEIQCCGPQERYPRLWIINIPLGPNGLPPNYRSATIQGQLAELAKKYILPCDAMHIPYSIFIRHLHLHRNYLLYLRIVSIYALLTPEIRPSLGEILLK
jgi:hypothetical protein